MCRREIDKSKVRTQSIELLVACLKPRGVGFKGFWRDINLVGDKAKRVRRYQFTRLQQPRRIA